MTSLPGYCKLLWLACRVTECCPFAVRSRTYNDMLRRRQRPFSISEGCCGRRRRVPPRKDASGFGLPRCQKATAVKHHGPVSWFNVLFTMFLAFPFSAKALEQVCVCSDNESIRMSRLFRIFFKYLSSKHLLQFYPFPRLKKTKNHRSFGRI